MKLKIGNHLSKCKELLGKQLKTKKKIAELGLFCLIEFSSYSCPRK
jgi:hypothetical protein